MLKNLLSPIKIGSLELKNRMIVPPMISCMAETDHYVNDKYIDYIVEKHKGGFAMVINEGHAVSEGGCGFNRMFGLFDDKFLPGQKKLVDAIHAVGGKACVQLMHSGRQSISMEENFLAVAPSAIKDITLTYTPKELTIDEIHQIVEDYGSAAARAKKAGYDAVEIHGAHGYLIHEFFSQASNKRTDEYGGSLENRARFGLEVVASVRAAVGEGFPIIYRMSTHECMPNGEGITVADSLALAMLLEKAGVDALHSTLGNYETERFQIAPAAVERALSANISAQLKQVVSIPVINVGKYTDPLIAEAEIATGKCDIVAFGRQSIADPYFPEKAAREAYGEIRRCIGCQIGCLQRLKNVLPISCTVNPRIGKEGKFALCPDKAEKVKKVVIIGGGIGGMQAALTASQRGHDVTLYEKEDRLGGQWTIAGVPPYKQEVNTFTVWLKDRLAETDATIVLNKEITTEEILADQPDVVIVASGATPMMPPIKGIDNKNVSTYDDILRSRVLAEGKTAVIGGGEVGCETACYLASVGKEVAVFEMMDHTCNETEPGVKYYIEDYMKTHDVDVHINAKVLEFAGDTVVCEENGQTNQYSGFTDIVMAIGRKPYDPFTSALEGKVKEIYKLGDAVKAHQGIDAVSQAFEIAYKL